MQAVSPLNRLTSRLEEWTGIAMDRAGVAQALQTYVETRVPELGLPSHEAYVEHLTAHPAELRELIDIVTVPHSWFFRDGEQWDVVQDLLGRAARVQPVVRVWVPGCATGEDAYTLAMIAARHAIAVEIVASDINRAAVSRARRGLYSPWAVRDVPTPYRNYLHPRGSDQFEVDESLRQSVSFATHNLLELPLASRSGQWDLVLCRNVFIYLVRSHAAPTLRRLGHTLRPGGWLVLGASDLVYSVPREFIADYERGRLVFRRAGEAMTLSPPPSPPQRVLRSPFSTARLAQIGPRQRSAPAAIVRPSAGQDFSAVSLVTRANQRLDAGEWSHAIALYEQAQQLDPLAPEPYFFDGVAHHKEGHIERAIHRLRSSLFLDPELWPASLYLALCYERMERNEEAALEYRRVAAVGHTPLRLQSPSSLSHDLEHWRREVVTLARRKGRPAM